MKGFIPVPSSEWSLGAAPAARATSPAPVGLRECLFKNNTCFGGRGFVSCLQQAGSHLHTGLVKELELPQAALNA